MTDLELYDEQEVLAILLAKPQENAWELSGLKADLFRNPVHREIASALVEVRDSGKRVHWKRVRGELRRRRQREAWAFTGKLHWAGGPPWGLTAAMSRLVFRKANPGREAA